MAEKRAIEKARRESVKAEQERIEREAVTLSNFFIHQYLPIARANKKEKSVEREEGLFNIWISPALGHMPMKDIAPFHLEQLKRDMAAGKQSPRSIEYALSVIRQVSNTAKRLEAFSGENPTSKVKFPKPDNGRMRFLTHAEADALLAALKARSADVHDITLLSLHCGLRWGEITALTWQDVDLERATMTIRDAKAGSRYAFLTDQAKAMLEGRTKGKPSEHIFTGRKGKMNICSLTFKRTVDDLKFNDGIEDPRLKVCFHTCRHSYASWLVEAGQDLYVVQRLLGHKTNQMTQRYSHISEAKFRDAANVLSKTMGNNEQSGQVVNFKK